jgi:hypothetical protein
VGSSGAASDEEGSESGDDGCGGAFEVIARVVGLPPLFPPQGPVLPL